MVKLKIDNYDVEVPAGTSILDAARTVQIEIPTLCKHPDVDPSAGCGMCIVRVHGRVMRSCCTPVGEGMEVITSDPELVDVRKTVLKLILSNHPNECLTCIRSGHCELQDMANTFGIRDSKLPSLNKKYDIDDSTKAIVLDASKCIVCGRCVEVCQNQQNVWALSYLNRGLATRITAAGGINLADSPCIKCGQCSAHCPTGAIVEYDETEKVWNMLNDKDLYTIVQIAPAVRVAIGEEFGYDFGENLTGKTYAALRRMGFKKVFDTNFGADLTITQGGQFLKSRILPHQNRSSLKRRTEEISALIQRAVDQSGAPGIRGEAETSAIASAWLDLAIACAKVSVKQDADERKLMHTVEATPSEQEQSMQAG